MRISVLFAFLFATTQAFNMPKVARQTLTRQNLMSQAETDKLVQHALDCSEGECSVDEVNDLVLNLKSQQKELSARIAKLDDLIRGLNIVNNKTVRKDDEVKETVRAIFRIFSHDESARNVHPSGFSGDIPKGGSKTAYDVLNPRKLKKSP